MNKKVEHWLFKSALSGSTELQEALMNGWEPFAVTSFLADGVGSPRFEIVYLRKHELAGGETA